MSDTKHLPPARDLDPEHVNNVSGGTDMCDAQSVQAALDGLKANYDALVDFVSHVIERVAS